mmetsp:Transcript_25505/g.51026  ORF Transcript_25505/g.51026 Transcript_25505/m.51026 type:complete len:266 (-) Transcript_25505:87-884(-)
MGGVGECYGTLQKVRYTCKHLLSLRGFAAPVEIDIDYEDGKSDEGNVSQEPAILCFRVVPTRQNEIKFHCDMDVPSNFIVHVYNLDPTVGWPQLNTFCAKTVGIKPLDVRMMRRRKPAQARLIFRSNDEANRFVETVPANARLKGSMPKFVVDTKAPKQSIAKEQMVSAVPLLGEPVAMGDSQSVATAVVCDPTSKGKLGAMDDGYQACQGAKGALESAVLCDAKGNAKAERTVKSSKGGKPVQFRAKQVTAICVAHMPSSMVDV